jgi:hypothetical protein
VVSNPSSLSQSRDLEVKWSAYLMLHFRATAADIEMLANTKNDEDPKQNDMKNDGGPKRSGTE